MQKQSSWQLPNASWVGFSIGMVLCSVAIYIQIAFRHSLADLPAGTEVRPMGLAVIEVGLALGGLLLGLPYSILGILLAKAERKHAYLKLGVAGMVLSLLPLPLSMFLFQFTLKATGITLAP